MSRCVGACVRVCLRVFYMCVCVWTVNQQFRLITVCRSSQNSLQQTENFYQRRSSWYSSRFTLKNKLKTDILFYFNKQIHHCRHCSAWSSSTNIVLYRALTFQTTITKGLMKLIDSQIVLKVLQAAKICFELK